MKHQCTHIHETVWRNSARHQPQLRRCGGPLAVPLGAHYPHFINIPPAGVKFERIICHSRRSLKKRLASAALAQAGRHVVLRTASVDTAARATWRHLILHARGASHGLANCQGITLRSLPKAHIQQANHKRLTPEPKFGSSNCSAAHLLRQRDPTNIALRCKGCFFVVRCDIPLLEH